MATLSIRGLYLYDSTLFDAMFLPDGVDKETLVQNLVAELAEVEVIYPSPVVMKPLIGIWSRKELPVWEKLYKTTTLTYDPISNYERNEEWVDSGSTTDTETNSGSDTANSSDTSTTTTSAFNSTALEPAQGASGSTTASTSYGHKIVNQHDINNITKTGRAWGNIGVTTTQKMITEEREVSQFNIYDFIIDSFRQRFCLLVY